MVVSLRIDYRESKLKNYFESFTFTNTDVKVSIENLDIGDIIIKNESINNCEIIIERKTISDLYSSINDGRYKEQKSRLLSNYKPEYIIYIIEGCSTSFQEKKFKNFFEIIRGAIINSVFRDNIKVIKTENLNESIEYIKSLVKKLNKTPQFFLENKSQEDTNNNDYVNNIKIKKKDNNDPKTCNIIMLCQIPGVSLSISKKIIETFESISSLIKNYNTLTNSEEKESMLKDLTYEINNNKTRKVGPVVSKRIYEYLLLNV